MAVTPSTLGVKFPEFVDVIADDAAFVTEKIAEAGRRVSVTAWDPHGLTDDGISYLAGHLIAVSPLGEQAKLDTDGDTTYLKEYKRMVRIVGSGCRAI